MYFQPPNAGRLEKHLGYKLGFLNTRRRGNLSGQYARAASLLNLRLRILAEVLGLDDDGVRRQVALAQYLDNAL